MRLLLPCAALAMCLGLQARAGDLLFYPQGPLFACSAYSVGGTDEGRLPVAERQADLARARRAGLNFIGPQYELDADAAADAARHGFAGSIRTIGINRDHQKGESLAISAEDLEIQIGTQVHAALNQGPVAFWNIRQEELRYWRADDMLYLDRLTQAIRRADAQAHPIMMYEPGHRSADELVQSDRFVDLVTMGIYVNYGEMMDNRVWVALAMQDQMAAAQRLGGKRGPFLIIEMFADPPADRIADIPAFVAHDIFRGLAEGAKGLIVFSFRHRAGFAAYDSYRDSYEHLLPLICGNAPLGQAIISGDRLALAVTIASGPLALDIAKYKRARTAAPVAATLFSHDGQRFLVLVNSANLPVTGVIEGIAAMPESARVLVRSAPAAKLEGNSFSLPALAVMVVEDGSRP